MNTESKHESVLMEEVMDALSIKPSDTVVDATIGGGGHFSRILEKLDNSGTLVGIDADESATERARELFAQDRRTERPLVHIVNDNFRNLDRVLSRLNIAPVDKILFDLGWSGYQILENRGFSFSSEIEQPLIMTYGGGGETAADIVNSASEEYLANIIYKYGEETFSRKIAKAIVEARRKNRITTTKALVDAILAGTPRWYHNRKTHPATKTFQALRIAVNDELGALKDGLASAISSLSNGGIVAVISFHSIEDRMVKEIFKTSSSMSLGEVITKKPIAPSLSEIKKNRRARSAKLRIFKREINAVEENMPISTNIATYV